MYNCTSSISRKSVAAAGRSWYLNSARALASRMMSMGRENAGGMTSSRAAKMGDSMSMRKDGEATSSFMPLAKKNIMCYVVIPRLKPRVSELKFIDDGVFEGLGNGEVYGVEIALGVL